MLSALLFLWAAGLDAQNLTVKGTVIERLGADALPLPGVSVLVKGESRGAVTDFEGRYEIAVRPDAVLEFSMLGYKTMSVGVAGRSVIDLTMETESTMLEQLVVVGYGVQKKSDLATSISSINTDDMRLFPAANAAEMLRGRAPGVTVTSGSGRPGSVPSITIRGSRSISASNSPLYIIDGSVASDTEFAMMNADDIESIEILKDAASQAIYGARASDGVILVTTKRGREGKSEIAYNGYAGVQTLHRNFDLYSADEYIALRREAVANDMGVIDARTIPLSSVIQDEIMQEVYMSDEFVDWESLMFKKAALYQSHEISLRGGSDKLRTMASAGWYSQDGIMRLNSDYSRLSVRANIDYEARKWLSFGMNTAFGFSDRTIENGAYYQFLTRSPLSRIYDENGEFTPYINSNKDTNPIYSALHDDQRESANNYRINAFADIKPFKGFGYRLNVSYYNRTRENGHSRDSKYPNGGGSTASITNYNTTSMQLENILRYDVPFASADHRLNITAVQSVDRNLYKTIGYTVGNLPVDKTYNYLASGEMTAKVRQYTANNLVSFMLRTQYNYKEKYLVNLAVRRDGSSRFGANSKWGTFPSAAFAWRLKQEPWMQGVKWLDNLKLRASYGIVGNQNGIDNYTTLGLARKMEGEWGDAYYMGYLPGTELSNADLRWEQSATANFGVDFSMLGNHITGTVEYYDTRTSNLLVTRALNAALGYTSMMDNLGMTRTNGIDVSLSADLIRSDDLNWSATLNFSKFGNRIIKIDDARDEKGNYMSQPGNNWIIGAPINIYYDYKADGIYQYDDFNVYSDGSGNLFYELKPGSDQRDDNVYPGSVRVKDVNRDGKITMDDRAVYKRDPDFTVSLTSSLSWKGFDFNMDWYARIGGYVLNPLLYDGEFGGDLRGRSNGIKVDYWTPYNPVNSFPRPIYGSETPYIKSLAYQDASYLRLRSVQIGYNFPSRFTARLGLEKLRVYATATNLLTFTKVLSYSPEVMGSSYPEAHQTVIGVNITL